MKLQGMIFLDFFALLIISCILQYCGASNVGSVQYDHHHNHTHDALKCFSCISIQNYPNMSAEGCHKAHPPTNYITTDCFGYNSPQAIAAIRHASGSDLAGHIVDPLNVHCVHIKGRNEVGGDIHVRGCIALPKGEVYPTKTCMSRQEFIFLPFGNVQNVEYCYCQGHGCNGAMALGQTSLFLTMTMLFLVMVGFVNK